MSNLQTAVRSGPVGSDAGQHPFRDGLVVREAQRDRRLYTPHFGRIEVVAAIDGIDEHAMAALWMIGLEEEPTQSAEICVFEVFGRDIRHDGSALVGMGVHPFRDPAIVDDFERVPFAGDVEPHRYAVDWRPDEVVFSIDGVVARAFASRRSTRCSSCSTCSRSRPSLPPSRRTPSRSRCTRCAVRRLSQGPPICRVMGVGSRST